MIMLRKSTVYLAICTLDLNNAAAVRVPSVHYNSGWDVHVLYQLGVKELCGLLTN